MNKHEFEEKVAYYAKDRGLFPSSGVVAVALSGGADSVALLRVLLSLGIECRALHCNFGLRGDESDRDEAFVRDLCRNLAVPLDVESFNVAEYEVANHVSTEMACRALRYTWFDEKMKSYGCVALAVAHHHDDNVETFFLNMLRGSGIQGLSGIRPRYGYVIRPLLCVTRNDIEEYLQELQQPYVVDSTNLTNDYKRNKIRNVVLPMLKELFPDADAGIARTLENLYGNNELYQEKVAELHDAAFDYGSDVSVIDMDVISALKYGRETAMYELLKVYGFNSEQVAEMYKCYFVRQSVGQRFFSSDREAVIGRGMIEILPIIKFCRNETRIVLTELLKGKYTNLIMTASVETKEPGESKIAGVDGQMAIALNMHILRDFPILTLRRWRKGDKIKPFGMRGTKLVSDLFTDAKYTQWQKRDSWLLCAGDEVLWIMGLRASSAYKVRRNDTEYILIKCL